MDDSQKLLKEQALFAKLAQNELAELASITHEESLSRGQSVIRQGDDAHYFYLILEGQLRVSAEDEKEESRTINILFPGEFFGDIALRYDEPYAATVTAEIDSKVLHIHENDFLDLLAKYPALEKRLDKLGRKIEKRTSKKFSGQNPDEIVLYYERRHWMALFIRQVKSLRIIIPLLLIAFLANFYFDNLSFVEGLPRWIITFSLAATVLKIVWEGLDWSNDYYIVTNKRVIQIDEVFGLKYERYEAPLNKIENVSVKHANPIEETLFGYAEVEIATAAQGGPGRVLMLDYMPDANEIVERIELQLNKAKGLIQQYGREQKRKALLNKVFDPKPPAAKKKKTPKPKPSWLQKRRQVLKKGFTSLVDYIRPRTREEKGKTIIWRKHWIALAQTFIHPRAFLLTLLLIAIAAGLWTLPDEYSTYAQVGGIFVALAFLAGTWWFYEDWRNDKYILEEDKIIDLELLPLGFGKEERSTTLDRIQDVRMTQNQPWMVWLGVGHVLIQTAGQDGDFTFDWVKDPQSVLKDIFQAIDNDEEKRQHARSFVINQEVLDWLKYYEEGRKERCATLL
jgi:CRP-like cAMP-binding protein